MKLTNNDKVSILLESQRHRYAEIHQMRERVYQLVTWIVGVFVLLSGWLIQGSFELSIIQKVLLSVIVCFASFATLWFIRDVYKGFKNQFQELHRTEMLLGMYQQGVFDKKERLLPASWLKRPGGGFFIFTQSLLIFATIFIVILIFLSGTLF